MTWYRNADPRYPFLWSDARQPAARWHGAGEGPANYFSDTPDGAWAEFLRHEEITTLVDLAGVSRAMWCAEVRVARAETPALPDDELFGDQASYQACQRESRALRLLGADSLIAPSAALKAGEAAGWRVNDTESRCPPPRDGRVLVVFGPPQDRVEGWMAAADARPPVRLLDSVRHFGS